MDELEKNNAVSALQHKLCQITLQINKIAKCKKYFKNLEQKRKK